MCVTSVCLVEIAVIIYPICEVLPLVADNPEFGLQLSAVAPTWSGLPGTAAAYLLFKPLPQVNRMPAIPVLVI